MNKQLIGGKGEHMEAKKKKIYTQRAGGTRLTITLSTHKSVRVLYVYTFFWSLQAGYAFFSIRSIT